jgi:hypothetical protein
MANAQPFRTTPSLGPQLNEIFTGVPYYDQLGNITSPSYKLGNVEFGNDGAQYVLVQAGGAIAATATTGTQVSITPAGVATTGAGGFYSPVNTAITSGQYFHARKGAYNAVV